MTSTSLKRIGQAALSYAFIVVALHFLLSGWVAPLAWGALALVVIAYAFNSLREVLVNKVLLETYKGEMEQIANRMVANVNCSFCGKPNAVRFQMGERNEFECQHCGKPNLLMIEAQTAQITVPLTEAVKEGEKAE